MRRRKGLPIHGWINLDKPVGPTSTQAIGRVRRITGAGRVGHAGTLDPLASGVLPIALGEATKTVPYIQDARKIYRFTVRWGQATTTDDREGDVIAESAERPGNDDIQTIIPRFTGLIAQAPPAFSAIRIAGERAYDLARAGVEVVLEQRLVTIHSARVADVPDPDHIEIEIECGKGTYVRAIARDLAETLGACGHVSALRRTRVGRFDTASAATLEFLEDLGHKARQSELLLPVETALDDIPELAVTAEDAFRLKQGRPIVLVPRQVEAVKARLKPGSRTVSAMAGGVIVALCEMRAGRLEPARVFHLEQSGD